MATKAEQFKSRQERARKKPKPSRASKKPSSPRPSDAAPVSRNASVAAGRKATFALEESDADRPSRKSTRGSTNRQKPDSNLKRRETRRVSSPARRAATGK